MPTIIQEQKTILRRAAVHLAHYRCLCNHSDAEQKLYSISSANAHLVSTIVGWAMVFGSHSEKTHWSNVIHDKKDRYTFVERCGISSNDWDDYHEKLLDCRRKFAAHHDITEKIPAPPPLYYAFKVAFVYYDDQLRGPGSKAGVLRDIYENTKSWWPRDPPNLDQTDSIVTTTT